MDGDAGRTEGRALRLEEVERDLPQEARHLAMRPVSALDAFLTPQVSLPFRQQSCRLHMEGSLVLVEVKVSFCSRVHRSTEKHTFGPQLGSCPAVLCRLIR